MRKADERDLKIATKSAQMGFLVASVLLVLLSIYRIIEIGNFLLSWVYWEPPMPHSGHFIFTTEKIRRGCKVMNEKDHKRSQVLICNSMGAVIGISLSLETMSFR